METPKEEKKKGLLDDDFKPRFDAKNIKSKKRYTPDNAFKSEEQKKNDLNEL